LRGTGKFEYYMPGVGVGILPIISNMGRLCLKRGPLHKMVGISQVEVYEKVRGICHLAILKGR